MGFEPKISLAAYKLFQTGLTEYHDFAKYMTITSVVKIPKSFFIILKQQNQYYLYYIWNLRGF